MRNHTTLIICAYKHTWLCKKAVQKNWNIPSFSTEAGGCDWWNACAAANISHSYWHYSSYCTTGPDFGNRSVPDKVR